MSEVTRAQMIREIRFVWWYFGEVRGSCNSGPYMGGMAYAQLCTDLGISYPGGKRYRGISRPGDYESIFTEGTDAQMQTLYGTIVGGYMEFAKREIRNLAGSIERHQEDLNEWSDMI